MATEKIECNSSSITPFSITIVYKIFKYKKQLNFSKR